MHKIIFNGVTKYLEQMAEIIDNTDHKSFFDTSIFTNAPIHAYNNSKLKYEYLGWDTIDTISLGDPDNSKIFEQINAHETAFQQQMLDLAKSVYISRETSLEVEKHKKWLKKREEIYSKIKHDSMKNEEIVNQLISICHKKQNYLDSLLKHCKPPPYDTPFDNAMRLVYHDIREIADKALFFKRKISDTQSTRKISEMIAYGVATDEKISVFTRDAKFKYVYLRLHKELSNATLPDIYAFRSKQGEFFLEKCYKVCTPEDGSINPEQLIPGFPPLRDPQSTNAIT